MNTNTYRVEEKILQTYVIQDELSLEKLSAQYAAWLEKNPAESPDKEHQAIFCCLGIGRLIKEHLAQQGPQELSTLLSNTLFIQFKDNPLFQKIWIVIQHWLKDAVIHRLSHPKDYNKTNILETVIDGSKLYPNALRLPPLELEHKNRICVNTLKLIRALMENPRTLVDVLAELRGNSSAPNNIHTAVMFWLYDSVRRQLQGTCATKRRQLRPTDETRIRKA